MSVRPSIRPYVRPSVCPSSLTPICKIVEIASFKSKSCLGFCHCVIVRSAAPSSCIYWSCIWPCFILGYMLARQEQLQPVHQFLANHFLTFLQFLLFLLSRLSETRQKHQVCWRGKIISRSFKWSLIFQFYNAGSRATNDYSLCVLSCQDSIYFGRVV